jgi:acetylornithine aminotransferase
VTLSGNRSGVIEAAAREHGLLVNAVKPDVIRLAPPLIVTEAEVDEAVAALTAAVRDAGAGGAS